MMKINILFMIIKWPFGKSTHMHSLGTKSIMIVVSIPRVYIIWSIAASGFCLAEVNHASVKVTMTSLRRTTVFCNHLPQ